MTQPPQNSLRDSLKNSYGPEPLFVPEIMSPPSPVHLKGVTFLETMREKTGSDHSDGHQIHGLYRTKTVRPHRRQPHYRPSLQFPDADREQEEGRVVGASEDPADDERLIESATSVRRKREQKRITAGWVAILTIAALLMLGTMLGVGLTIGLYGHNGERPEQDFGPTVPRLVSPYPSAVSADSNCMVPKVAVRRSYIHSQHLPKLSRRHRQS